MNATPDPAGSSACASPDTRDAELEAIADDREIEMDRDPSASFSHEDMLAYIHRRAARGSAQQMLEILSQAPINRSLRK
jgi:hypothetical protein|uniref:hypothetical protein n=1 Tax=Prosthecobacter sp. TaxID=1965333 RepID=UPI00378424A1